MLYDVLITLVLVGVLALFFLAYINSVVNNSLFERNYYVRDSAMMASVMYAAPGDVSYTYGIKPLNEFDFFMTLNDSTTVIKDASYQDVEYVYPDDVKFKNPKLAFSTLNIQNINTSTFNDNILNASTFSANSINNIILNTKNVTITITIK